VGNEPVIGWRVWVLANNCLCSIAKNAFWRPGENQAECFVGHERDIPVPSCHCGFWALHNPVAAMRLAADVESGSRVSLAVKAVDPHRIVAVGLIHGYGAIAMHGSEGYRAGLASVACIFSDAPHPLSTEPLEVRRTVADEYGVPCITLDAAISIGFLYEMGVGPQAVEQLKAWIATGRPVPDADEFRLSRQVARLRAQGLNHMETARSLNLRTAKLPVDTSARDLVRWIAEHGR
jgi:hypothetical protein